MNRALPLAFARIVGMKKFRASWREVENALQAEKEKPAEPRLVFSIEKVTCGGGS